MSSYTIIDSQGEVVSILDISDIDTLSANIPATCSAIAGHPTVADAYRLSGSWLSRGTRPSDRHSWNTTTKVWEDVRSMTQRRIDAGISLRNARDAASNPPLVVGGNSFPNDPVRISAAATVALNNKIDGITMIRRWAKTNGETVLLNRDDILELARQSHSAFQDAQERELDRLESVALATTPAEVAAAEIW